MIKSIVREFKWTPETIDSLFIDDYDHHGIEYWYQDVQDLVKEIKSQSKKDN